MKLKRFVLLVVVLLSLLLIAAGSSRERVGDWFVLPTGSWELHYYVNTPFHIDQWWHASPGSDPIPTGMPMARGSMRLVIDDIDIEQDFIEYIRVESEGVYYIQKHYVYNFPTGMEGTHKIQLYLTNTCSTWLEYFSYAGYVDHCDDPNQLMEFLRKDLVVYFDKLPD